ncbi:hypothetical protein [Moorena sp. SIO3F7]|uniref:hypothetical protein n=1 Tax=Moorena sp. SIO3F7 TaxID=2607839 RepID=UPI00140107C1|nr:hypothetical protein [Moorena sp. SIO3F7]NEO17011.1 hypothetical protein [Moorena sp. SIO3E8]NEQ03888.1 hypothetical protein [Moorena sp. SIO3F7]
MASDLSYSIPLISQGSRESGVGSRELGKRGKCGRWGDGEMGRWGDGEMERWGDAYKGRFFKKGRVGTFITYKLIKICIKIHYNFRDNSSHFPLFPTPYSRFPIPDSRLPIPDSRFPTPCSLYIDIAR